MKKVALTLMTTLLLCSCGDERDYWLDGQIRERKPETFQPEIFISQRPTKPYKEIALARFETRDNPRKQTAQLKNLCRARGGDAIIVGNPGGDSRTSTDFFGGVQSQQFTNAVIIEYTERH